MIQYYTMVHEVVTNPKQKLKFANESIIYANQIMKMVNIGYDKPFSCYKGNRCSGYVVSGRINNRIFLQ
jgi:hypothetical protein